MFLCQINESIANYSVFKSVIGAIQVEITALPQ